MHWGWQCTAPNELLDTGPGDAPKGTSPRLGGGVHAFFCLVSGLQCMGKCVAWIQERWQCNVMLAFMGGMLGQGTHLQARLPALAYAKVCLNVFSFIVFICSLFFGKEMGGVVGFALCCVVCLAR